MAANILLGLEDGDENKREGVLSASLWKWQKHTYTTCSSILPMAAEAARSRLTVHVGT